MGHQQSFAFCSAHWVRSHDHFTRQQTLTFFSGTCSQHIPQPYNNHHLFTQLPPLHTCCRQQNTGGSTEGHGDRKRAGVQGTPAIFFLLIYISYSFPLPAQPSLFWGMPHPPDNAMSSCWTQRTRCKWCVLHFWWLFFIQT